MQKIWIVHGLRFLAFFFSIFAFICHSIQCALLKTYQSKTGIPDWLSVGHWQYLTWYISLAISTLGGLAVCLSAFYFKRPTKYSLDKCVGSIAILPILCSIITASLFDSSEPWTNGLIRFERPSSKLLVSCHYLDAAHDKHYPILYQRCLLNDSTWITALCALLVWIFLLSCVMYATFRKRSQVHSVSDSTPAQEPTWGRYIPDDPSTLYASDQLYRSFNYDNYEKSKLDSYYYDKEQPKFETGLFKSESFHFNLPEIHSDNTFDQSFTYRMERSSNTHHDTSLELHREHIKHSY